jgi:hypothetical protein
MLRTSSSSSIGTTTLSWVSSCSTGVEHSQQEDFTDFTELSAARPTPNLEENQGFRTFQLSPQEAPASEAMLANPGAEGGTMDKKWPRNFAESGDFHVTFGFLYMP